MKKVILAICIFALCGCTYTVKPYPMKPDMVSKFQTDSSIHVINSQASETGFVENSGASKLKVNLREATDSTISLFKEELAKSGVDLNNSSAKTIALSLDKLHMGNYFVAVGCTATVTVETNSGISKIFKEQNTSGIDIFHACDFAITKIVASIINDPGIRSFIDPAFAKNNSSNKRLIELKQLLLDGLITDAEFEDKKSKILEDI